MFFYIDHLNFIVLDYLDYVQHVEKMEPVEALQIFVDVNFMDNNCHFVPLFTKITISIDSYFVVINEDVTAA